MFRIVSCTALCVVCLPLSVSAAPVVEVTKDRIDAVVGEQLYNQPENPFADSLTAPSVNQAQNKLSRMTGAVDLVPAEEYQNAHAVTFKDMLQSTPGVFAEPRFGEEVRLSIRGSGLSRGFHLRGITLLQDGVPINLSDDGGDFQEIDPLTTRYTEVLKGANGWVYGASSLGGAINVVTPTGYTAPERNLISIEGGSFGTIRLHQAAARIVGKADYYIAATETMADGFRDQSQEKKGRVNTNIGYRFNDTAETRFYLTYNNLNQEVPGTLSLRDALDHPGGTLLANRIGDQQRDIRSMRVANVTTFKIGDKTLDVGASAAFKDLFHPIFQVIDQESADYGVFSRLKGHYQLGDHRNEYQMGVHGKMGHINALQFANVNGSRGAKTADADQDATQLAFNAENQFFVTPQWALVTGGQFVRNTRNFSNNLVPANSDDRHYYAFNPKLGTIWDVTRGAQIFANVARSAEAPTFSELVQAPLAGFVPLNMQNAWTTEIGTRGRHRDLAWDLTAYRSHVKDELINFTTAPGIPAATFNANTTIHQGLELGLDWEIGKRIGFIPADDKLVWRQVYNLNDFRFQNDVQYGDNRIAGIPQHQYRTELNYNHRNIWSVTPHVELVPHGGYIDQANTFRVPGYATFGIKATYNVTPDITLFADGRNLTDKRYVSNYSTVTNAATANTAVFYPGEGRGLFAGVKIAF